MSFLLSIMISNVPSRCGMSCVNSVTNLQQNEACLLSSKSNCLRFVAFSVVASGLRRRCCLSGYYVNLLLRLASP